MMAQLCELHRDPKQDSEPYTPQDFDPFAEDPPDKRDSLPVLPEEDFNQIFR